MSWANQTWYVVMQWVLIDALLAIVAYSLAKRYRSRRST